MVKAWDKGKKYVQRGYYCGWSVTHSTSLKKYYSHYSPVTTTATAAAMAFTETSPTVFYPFDFKSYDNPKRKLLQEPLPFRNSQTTDWKTCWGSYIVDKCHYRELNMVLLGPSCCQQNLIRVRWTHSPVHDCVPSSWHTAGTKTGEQMGWTRGKEKKESEGETEHYFLF